jgi:HSP20 family protein
MLTRWNPWQDLYDMQRETSELARRFFGGTWTVPTSDKGGNGTTWSPAVDVFTRGKDLVVRAELPGVNPEKDIDVSYADGMLTISGERRHQDKVEDQDFYRFESSYGSFLRRIPLPESVKVDDIRAVYEDGVLEVVVPGAASMTTPKRIPISAGGRRTALTAKGRKQ